MGLQEWHLWGKAEIEDRLYRPENDGLLFAYFGVSLTIRRRSQRADLRAKLAMKRKANRLLRHKENDSVLLRSPDALEYPNAEGIPDFEKRPQWLVRKYLGFNHDGLEFLLHRHFAYLADDEKSWDAMLCCDDAVDLRDDYWRSDKNSRAKRNEAWHAWEAIPEKDRAWLEVVGIVPFEDILGIDEIGDDYFSDPHVYAPFNGKNAPFRHFYARVQSVSTFDLRRVWPSDEQEDRVVKFPAGLRERPDAQP